MSSSVSDLERGWTVVAVDRGPDVVDEDGDHDE